MEIYDFNDPDTKQRIAEIHICDTITIYLDTEIPRSKINTIHVKKHDNVKKVLEFLKKCSIKY